VLGLLFLCERVGIPFLDGKKEKLLDKIQGDFCLFKSIFSFLLGWVRLTNGWGVFVFLTKGRAPLDFEPLQPMAEGLTAVNSSSRSCSCNSCSGGIWGGSRGSRCGCSSCSSDSGCGGGSCRRSCCSCPS
jgi:hypothetical protein